MYDRVRSLPSPPPSPPTAALHLLFFASGATALVYEVLWMRRFTVLFGGTALAAAVTVAALFLGIAAGSAVAGRRAPRLRRPLAAFGWLEVMVGAGAVLATLVLDLYARVLGALPADAPAALLLSAKLLLAFAATGPAAFAMGGTLPVLAEAAVARDGRLGASVGGLYAANLAGAVAGTLAVPFLLLPRLGAHGAYAAAVAGSLAVGTLAIALSRSAAPRGARDRATDDGPPVSRATRALAAFSGAATLGLQVLWNRAFALVHENSTHAFAVVVALFLVGLAGGAAAARAALRRGADPWRTLGLAWCAAGALVVASPILVTRVTGGLAFVDVGSWSASLGRLTLLASVVALPATIALGLALPLLLETETGGAPGRTTGRLVAWNTAGAIVGPLAAALVVAPAAGLWPAIALVGVLTALAGAGVLKRRRAWAALPALGGAAVLLAWPVPPVRVGAGETLLSRREGIYGTTAVLEDARDRWITVNNTYVLGGTAAAGEERFQTHLPLLLHPSPRRVAFVGLGTGVTAGAVLDHPFERATALEIVPDVVDAARTDFADANLRVLDDPRVTAVADDGRHYLASRPHAFDVIVQDLLVPWRPGEAALYAREHFQAVRRALTADGVFCQWLPVYQLSDEDLRVALATFADVFPEATVWRGTFLPGQETVALCGHLDPRPLDAEAIAARVRALPARAREAHPFVADPAGVFLHLVGPLAADAAAPRNTDAWPWLELHAPAGHGRRIAGAPLPALAEAAGRPLGGTPLAAIGADALGWRATGAALAEASRTPGPAGEARVLELLRTLPAPLRDALGVDP
jgi:spermidine synthase